MVPRKGNWAIVLQASENNKARTQVLVQAFLRLIFPNSRITRINSFEVSAVLILGSSAQETAAVRLLDV